MFSRFGSGVHQAYGEVTSIENCLGSIKRIVYVPDTSIERTIRFHQKVPLKKTHQGRQLLLRTAYVPSKEERRIPLMHQGRQLRWENNYFAGAPPLIA